MAENDHAVHPDHRLDYCASEGTTISRREDGTELEVLHLCRYPAEHPQGTPHQCWLCTTTWTDETPC